VSRLRTPCRLTSWRNAGLMSRSRVMTSRRTGPRREKSHSAEPYNRPYGQPATFLTGCLHSTTRCTTGWMHLGLYGHYLQTVIPSPTHSFIPGLKPSFSANPSHRSLSFSSSGLTTWIPKTVYCYFLAYSVFYFLVFLFLHFLVVGSVR